MRNNLLPMVKAVQWHPMLPDIIGRDVARRYMVIGKKDGEFYSLCQQGMRPLKSPETLDAILEFYEDTHGSQIKRLINSGIEIIVDFERQRLTLSDSGCSIIKSANNTPFSLSIARGPYYESKASTLFALHWLKNNTVDHENVLDIAVGEGSKPSCNVQNETHVNNVLDFNQWRKKVTGIA